MMEDSRERMISRLKKIWDDRDFILGVDVQLRNEQSLNEMIEYLEMNKDIELDPSDVTETALYIRYGDSIKHKLSKHITVR